MNKLRTFALVSLLLAGLASAVPAFGHDAYDGDGHPADGVENPVVEPTDETPQPRLIAFADAVVKEICLAHWDLDGDGELSQDEAAAVATLGTVFRQRQDITTFHELRHFTGLFAIGDYAFYRSSLREFTLPPSVSEIGFFAFSETPLAGELLIPGTVRIIRGYAFASCRQATRIVLGEGVEEIGSEAFTGPIRSMVLPGSITWLASEFVNPFLSNGLESRDYEFYLFVEHPTPVPCSAYAFRRLFGDGVLVVPQGAREAYQTDASWRNFYRVVEMGDVNEDGVTDDADLEALKSYVAGGTPTPFNALLADVNRDGAVDEADATVLQTWLWELYPVPTAIRQSSLPRRVSVLFTTDGKPISARSLPSGVRVSRGRKVVAR